ncbi:hypothetical protein EWB00_004251 [Schistosoma japonicum]|uniref:BHLH domain-containing protein n=2 Tax=Schistosoma japonicum TaxID=6182 RepID=A0A4Z2D5F6_SCHJA|nr:hypothetical protein KSF78_0001007 [Schistosoma japonicum]TNN11723.1 hypothetical protein EWB00_004251 [Schistosoma japonicum]
MIPVRSTVTNYFPMINSMCEEFVASDIKVPLYNLTLPTESLAISRNSVVNNIPNRRGRRSTIPLEIREEVRRLKKRHTERQRRACISDKMNALHNLAMKLIGEDPSNHPKMEKNDVLGICYTIFEGIAKILKDRPELLSRLHNLTTASQETKNINLIPHSSDSVNVQPSDQHSSLRIFPKPEQKSARKDQPSQLSPTTTNNTLHSQEMRQNSNMEMSLSFSSSGMHSESKSVSQRSGSKYKIHTFRLPLKCRWSKVENQNMLEHHQINDVDQHGLSFVVNDQSSVIQKLVKSRDDLLTRQMNGIGDDQKENIPHYTNEGNVWRPYLN